MDQFKALWSNQAVRYGVYAVAILVVLWIVWGIIYPTPPVTNVTVVNQTPAKKCLAVGATILPTGLCSDGTTPS